MRGINKAIIVGTLGQDPETRQTSGGNSVANLSVATNEAWTDKQTGEKKESTEWHRIVLWGRVAEIAGQYLSKGSKVYLEGRIQTRKYEKDGVTHYSTEIVANDLQMLGDAGGSRGEAPQQRSAPQQRQPQGGGVDSEDIPF